MRIAFVCDEYPPLPHGGIGTFVQTVGRELATAGHRVSVFGVAGEGSRWSDRGVEVEMLPWSFRLRRGGVLWNRLRLWRHLRRCIRPDQFDILEVPDYLGMLPLPVGGVPVVVRLHTTLTAICGHTHLPLPRSIGVLEYLNLRWHRRWIAVSQFVLDNTAAIFGLKPRQVCVIPHPFCGERDAGAAPELPEKFVLYGGAIRPFKGALTLAHAACEFLPPRADLHLVYVGEDVADHGTSTVAQVREILGPQLQSRLHVLPRQPRPILQAIMAKASVFAFPSTFESMGLVTGEALLQQTPVITSNIPPFTEYLQHGRTALLVPPDTPHALADSVAWVLANPRAARDMARRGRDAMQQRFSVARCVDATLDFYRACLGHSTELPSGVKKAAA
jgi:glycosyltransferase involved in cell wall biosynthesis